MLGRNALVAKLRLHCEPLGGREPPKRRFREQAQLQRSLCFHADEFNERLRYPRLLELIVDPAQISRAPTSQGTDEPRSKKVLDKQCGLNCRRRPKTAEASLTLSGRSEATDKPPTLKPIESLNAMGPLLPKLGIAEPLEGLRCPLQLRGRHFELPIQLSDSSSACWRTVCVAASCLSGG